MSEEQINNKCPINVTEWVGILKTNDNLNHDSDGCNILCCPLKTPLLLLLLPCTLYNICMNKINKKYIC